MCALHPRTTSVQNIASGSKLNAQGKPTRAPAGSPVSIHPDTHTEKRFCHRELCLKGSRRNADAVFSTLLKGASCQSPSPGSHSPAGLGQAGLAGLARGGDLGTWGVLRSCEAVNDGRLNSQGLRRLAFWDFTLTT